MKRNEFQSEDRLKQLLDQFRDVSAREPGAAAAGRQKFLKQAASQRASPSRRPQPSSTSWTDRLLSLFQGMRRLPVSTILVAAFLAFVVLFGGSVVTVYAAQDSLPDGPLYGVKTFSEDTLLFLTASPQKRLDLTLYYTDRRLSEMASLQSAGRPIPQNVVERFQSELDQTLELAAGLDNPALAKSLEQLSLHAEGQTRKMSVIINSDPDAADLVKLNARLEQQVQDLELGKADPLAFRLKVREQDLDERGRKGIDPKRPGKPGGTPAATGEGANSGTTQPDATAEPGKHDPNKKQPTEKSQKVVNYQGTIAAVDAIHLTLTLTDGSSLTFVLNADTKINISGLGNDATVVDLKVGDSATVRASQDDSGALIASMIEVKLTKPVLDHYTGTVIKYQEGVSITIQDKKGASLIFLITADTKIKFGPKDDGDTLAVGSNVTIVAMRAPAGGTPTAKEIAVQKQK